MAEQDEEKKAFIVRDRRRFDASGNPRSGDAPSEESAAPRAPSPQVPKEAAKAPRSAGEGAKAKAEPVRPAPPPPDEDPLDAGERAEWDAAQQEAKDAMDAVNAPRGPVSFAEFLLSIATNAVIHLGGDTRDGRVPSRVNLTLAAQHIDILAMVAEKTHGNLDHEEQDLLDSLLYDLRMKYVAVAQAQAQGAGARTRDR